MGGGAGCEASVADLECHGVRGTWPRGREPRALTARRSASRAVPVRRACLGSSVAVSARITPALPPALHLCCPASRGGAPSPGARRALAPRKSLLAMPPAARRCPSLPHARRSATSSPLRTQGVRRGPAWGPSSRAPRLLTGRGASGTAASLGPSASNGGLDRLSVDWSPGLFTKLLILK